MLNVLRSTVRIYTLRRLTSYLEDGNEWLKIINIILLIKEKDRKDSHSNTVVPNTVAVTNTTGIGELYQ